MFSHKEKIVLFCLAAIQFNHIVDFMIVMPLGPQLMREFTISPEQFSFLVSVYSFCAGISGFLATFYADRFDRKKILIFMFSGFILATALCGLSKNFDSLLIFRSMAGFFGGVMNSLTLSIVSDLIDFKRRGSAMGLMSTSFSVASIAGVPFSLYLAQIFTWHSPFFFLAGLSAFVLTITFLSIPKMTGHLKSGLSDFSYHDVLKPLTSSVAESTQKWALVFMFMVMFSHFMIIPFISPSLVANAGLLESHLPLVYLIGGFCSIISGPLIGRFCDRFGKSKMYVYGLIFSILPVFVMTHLGPTTQTWVLAVSGLFFISAGARMIPAQTLVSQASRPETRGSFLSLVSCVQSIAMALGAWISGQIVTKNLELKLIGYDTVGYIAIAIGLFSLLMISRLSAIEKVTT